MKNLKYITVIAISTVGIYACNSSKNIASKSNKENLKIEISAIEGKDSTIRTFNGDTIGRIDKEGNVYDRGGNKIGKRELTDAEKIQQVGF